MSIPSNATQFLRINKNESHTVVIGLDFGTSSSKVVVHNITAGVAFAIPFEVHGHPSNRYLLPTRPYFNKEGNLKISSINDGIPLRELKGLLIGNTDLDYDFIDDKELNADPEILAIAYLARTIQLARHWFLTQQEDSFGHVNVDWHLNLGVPSTGETFNEKKSLFRKIAKAAWFVSVFSGKITLETVKKGSEIITDETAELKDIHPDNINVIPEVVAEIMGYVRSHLRKLGLHILVDIGAGTLDITSINLYEDNGEIKYPILTGEVKWLGGFELHKHRIAIVKSRISDWLHELGKDEDPVKPIPIKTENYLPEISELDLSQKRSLDDDFFGECRRSIHETMHHIRKKRYPSAPEWKSGIRCFICGGGKYIEFYADVLKEVDTWWKGNGTAGLDVQSLPQPENLNVGGLNDDDYHRIAVAYGLSFPIYDFGEIKPPSEIEDAPTPELPRDYTDDFISKDQV